MKKYNQGKFILYMRYTFHFKLFYKIFALYSNIQEIIFFAEFNNIFVVILIQIIDKKYLFTYCNNKIFFI